METSRHSVPTLGSWKKGPKSLANDRAQNCEMGMTWRGTWSGAGISGFENWPQI